MFKNWFHKEEEEKDPVSRLDAPKKNLFDRLVDSLQKTRAKLTEQIDEVIKGYAKIDEELFEDLEDILVSADVGVQTTMTIMDGLRERVRTGGITDPAGIKELLSEQMVELIREQDG